MKNATLFASCALMVLLQTACTQFPALDSSATPALLAADYPRLVPVDPLLARAQAGQVDQDRAQAGLIARVAALQARAARLRGSVLSGPEKQRLSQGLR